MSNKTRIFLTGVGGQGTLTATTLLARIGVDEGIETVAGEIHGMAQRGGVVESAIVFGGWKSPKLSHGEADIILGFELLETLRALPYLCNNGIVFSSSECLPPASVSLGKEKMPTAEQIKDKINVLSKKSYYLPIRSIGVKLGIAQLGNAALLGCACESGLLPFDFNALVRGIEKYIPLSQVKNNISAAEVGRDMIV